MEMTMTCAEESRAAQERLAGTFKPADTFFLIQTSLAEYGGWGGEVVKKAGASGGFAPYLQHLMKAPRAKILFIRRPASEGKNFYIAVSNQARPRIYHTILSDYDELLTLELDSIGEDRCPRINDYDMHDEGELYTVCTNGRHDPCCAARGTPFYQALIQHAGEDKVWQTSHIGGHRMAATMIAFPQGIVYGHLDPADAEAVVTNHRSGYLLTHKYRGRGAYAGHRVDSDAHQAVSAAEGLIRERARLYADGDLRLSEVIATGDQRWRISFLDGGGARHDADVNMGMSAPRQTSCGEAPKPMPEHEITLLT